MSDNVTKGELADEIAAGIIEEAESGRVSVDLRTLIAAEIEPLMEAVEFERDRFKKRGGEIDVLKEQLRAVQAEIVASGTVELKDALGALKKLTEENKKLKDELPPDVTVGEMANRIAELDEMNLNQADTIEALKDHNAHLARDTDRLKERLRQLLNKTDDVEHSFVVEMEHALRAENSESKVRLNVDYSKQVAKLEKQLDSNRVELERLRVDAFNCGHPDCPGNHKYIDEACL